MPAVPKARSSTRRHMEDIPEGGKLMNSKSAEIWYALEQHMENECGHLPDFLTDAERLNLQNIIENALADKDAKLIREEKLHQQANIMRSQQQDRDAATISRLRELVVEAGEVVEPFADLIQGNYANQPDEMFLKVGTNLHDLRLTTRLGYFRDAKAFRDKIKDMCHERSEQADKSVSASPLQTGDGA